MASTHVFANPDGTNFPQAAPGWTVQSAGAFGPIYVHATTASRVTPTPDHIDSPANVNGWTVQNSSDQSLVAHTGA